MEIMTLQIMESRERTFNSVGEESKQIDTDNSNRERMLAVSESGNNGASED